MNLIKFKPFVSTKHSNFNSFVDEFFNTSIADFVGSDFANNHLAVNIVEAADDFRLEVAAPGLAKADFKINIEKNQLTISAKKEKKAEVKDEKFTRREFNYTSFSRTFHLSEKVDSSAIVATYDNGVLNVTVPKKEEAKEKAPFNIEVK